MESEDNIEIKIYHHGKPITYTFADRDASMQDLSDRVSEELSVPPENQKFLVAPKTGIIRPPFTSTSTQTALNDNGSKDGVEKEKNSSKNIDNNYPLSALLNKRITLMGSTSAEVNALSSVAQDLQQKRLDRSTLPHLRPVKPTPTNPNRNQLQQLNSLKYTFHTIRPLPHLPNPSRSSSYLHRLASDPGIRAAMHRHHFSVSLLTEMDPIQHTTHESRTLGLNRNNGEVIELRLRTDAHDGYRDYKTIRDTLCHELAHNVWGEHDRNFWDLYRRIQKEVDRDDWNSGGRSLGGERYYQPEASRETDGGMMEEVDHGGWSGGEYVLAAGGGGDAANMNTGLSRRQILAQAAEERMKRASRMQGTSASGNAEIPRDNGSKKNSSNSSSSSRAR